MIPKKLHKSNSYCFNIIPQPFTYHLSVFPKVYPENILLTDVIACMILASLAYFTLFVFNHILFFHFSLNYTYLSNTQCEWMFGMEWQRSSPDCLLIDPGGAVPSPFNSSLGWNQYCVLIPSHTSSRLKLSSLRSRFFFVTLTIFSSHVLA